MNKKHLFYSLLFSLLSYSPYAFSHLKLQDKTFRQSIRPNSSFRWIQKTLHGIPIYGLREKEVTIKGKVTKISKNQVQELTLQKRHDKSLTKETALSYTNFNSEEVKHLHFQPVYFQQQTSLIPAYHLQVTLERDVFTVILSDTPPHQILLEKSEKHTCLPSQVQKRPLSHFKVFNRNSPYPSNPHPNGNAYSQWQAQYQIPEVKSEVISCESPKGWVDQQPMKTKGNNVAVYSFIDAQPANLTSASSDRDFLYHFDLYHNANLSLEAASVNAFYHLNIFHDLMYKYGFREADGNFQSDNFQLGGVQGDALEAHVFWSSTLINNAFYAGTEIDGTPGIITFLRFVRGQNQLDRMSAFSNDILYHEVTHGMTRRLVGRMDSYQALALNEGVSDFVGLLLTTPEDAVLRDEAFAFAPWVSFRFNGHDFEENYYFGFRKFPYTTDENKNPLTLADIDIDLFDAGSAPQSTLPSIIGISPHSSGSIWANTLWDIFVNLSERYGFSLAKEKMLTLLIEALKLTPEDPHFLQARDAFLLADESLFDGEERVLLWSSFARKGMGVSAVITDSSQFQGIVEAFDLPNIADYDQNGTINFFDISRFLNDFEQESYRADLNLDHHVDYLDVKTLVDYFR